MKSEISNLKSAPESETRSSNPAAPSANRALLVIAYGNELRTDDGLGPHLGRAIAERNYPGVQVTIAHQLTPELAEEISRAGAVLFIDAAVGANAKVEIGKVARAAQPESSTHFVTPAGLLTLAAILYDSAPPAWSLTLPATELGFGQSLSAEGRRVFALGLKQFESIWDETARSCRC